MRIDPSEFRSRSLRVHEFLAAIVPFRRFLVYPIIIQRIERMWAERYAAKSTGVWLCLIDHLKR